MTVAGLLVLSGCLGFGLGSDTGTADDEVAGDLEIHHIDVGQADATLLVTPADETILIDTGDWRPDGEQVIDYLEDEGIDRIDHLVATHAHADHIGGHAAVIEHVEEHGDGVGAAYDSGVVHTSQTYDNYLDAVEEYEVTLFEVAEGDTLPLEGDSLEATVLNPPEGDSGTDFHYNSVTLLVEYDEFAYLTTGDAEADAEQRLVDDRGDDLDAEGYQAGHHGSSTSSTEPFLDAVDPEITVISSALESQYGHPDDEVLESFADRGVETYWTAVHGDVVLTTDGSETSVTTEHEEPTEPETLLEYKHEAHSDEQAALESTVPPLQSPLQTAASPALEVGP
ncbi:beta-lactamase [Natronolimnohabitans innermongolicus JCM 12255]|uniref:Beta-lactamase n=1 Tax=Natronolimnohabitans innermongolicus JCM 12255 TaxID=1227499 RepID=L9WUM1_9EURY|nr:beta-lactamase [Natronolimnohabitans innermongolicus JCM 12255]